MNITLPNGCTARMDERGHVDAINAPALDLMTPWLATECARLVPADLAGARGVRPCGTVQMWARSTCGLYLVWAVPHSRDHDGLCVD